MSEKLNHDRRAARKQRAKQQSQVQIIHHAQSYSPECLGRQIIFQPFFGMRSGKAGGGVSQKRKLAAFISWCQ
jgi:hypothetical protein